MKGLQKIEIKRKEKGESKYRTGEESLESRIRKKLTETTKWYKKSEEEKIEEERTACKEKTWREWRKSKKWKRIINREKKEGKESEKKDEGEKLQGILFVAHTKNSELAKRIRNSLETFEKYIRIRLKVIERAGEKVADVLHKSNPWSGLPCTREECRICSGGNEKLWGRCRDRNVV